MDTEITKTATKKQKENKADEVRNITGVIETKKRSNSHILDIVYVAMFTAIITICSQIEIPTAIPFTMQTFAVFAAAGILGAKKGTLSVLLYILIGAIGIPVYAQWTGGAGILFGITGGYIAGFIFIALIVGRMCDKLGRKLWVLAVSMTIGMIVCYAFGTVWFIFVCSRQAEPVDFISALGLCVIPYLPFDAAKIAAATIIVNRLKKPLHLS